MRQNSKILHSIILILLVSACISNPVAPSTIRSVTVESANELISSASNVIVLDVRTPDEFHSGHIPGAININIRAEDFSTEVAKLDRNKTYILHCSANVKNGRTEKSLKIMSELGFKNLLDLSGGIAAWAGKDKKIVY